MRHKVAKVSDFKVITSQRIQLEGADVALFKKDGRFFAIANICPHKGASLAEGHLEGAVVTCGWHAWQFDVTNGQCQNVPGVQQKCFPVIVEGEDIFIDV